MKLTYGLNKNINLKILFSVKCKVLSYIKIILHYDYLIRIQSSDSTLDTNILWSANILWHEWARYTVKNALKLWTFQHKVIARSFTYFKLEQGTTTENLCKPI